MSTYYFLVCDETKFTCDAASANGCNACGFMDPDDIWNRLPSFIVAHRDKQIKIVSEHELESIDNPHYQTYREWTARVSMIYQTTCEIPDQDNCEHKLVETEDGPQCEKCGFELLFG